MRTIILVLLTQLLSPHLVIHFLYPLILVSLSLKFLKYFLNLIHIYLIFILIWLLDLFSMRSIYLLIKVFQGLLHFVLSLLCRDSGLTAEFWDHIYSSRIKNCDWRCFYISNYCFMIWQSFNLLESSSRTPGEWWRIELR